MYSCIHSNGIVRKLSSDQIFYLIDDESKWIIDTKKKLGKKCILLTHSDISYKPLLDDCISNPMYSHLYGSYKTLENKSYSGNTIHWTGLNMGNHSGFLPDAFYELYFQSEVKKYETLVKDILESSSPILRLS